MEQYIPHYPKAIVLIALTLVINFNIGCSKKEQSLKISSEKILNTILKGQCERIKKAEGYSYILLEKIEFKDVSYLNSLFDCFESSLKEEILTKGNIKFFEEQIKMNIDSIDFISETNCIKKALPVTEMPIPINCDSRCFKVSEILYTKDYKYAIFLTSSITSTINIYILKNGKYIPYKGCITSIS